MNVLGLSCYHHDAAACLVQDGRVVAAVQEERFNRQKNSPVLPVNAINHCLQAGGVTIADVNHVAFHERPFLKLERVVMSHLRAWPRSRRAFVQALPPWLQDRLILPLTLKSHLGYDGPTYFSKHHLSHAASSFLCSPFTEAAILVADGVGEWATTTLGVGHGTQVEIQREMRFPDSLGLLYAAVTTWLGFAAMQGEDTVMALAGHGEPVYLHRFQQMVELRDDGSFCVDPRCLGVPEGERRYGAGFVQAFGPPRVPGQDLDEHHMNVAASLQRLLEEAVLRMARHLHRRTGLRQLCLAGGVFLNVCANSRLLAETPFDELFIQPAAGDAGAAIGAALLLHHRLSGGERRYQMRHAFLGPEYGDSQVRRLLVNQGARFEALAPADLARRVARLLADGHTVGWFEGRLEFGPQGLGHRSILADPRDPDMKDRLNARIKHREPFRPYGVSILREAVHRFFHFNGDSPFMLLAARARGEVKARIPSALHVDGSSRLQTVTAEQNGLYYEVIRQFGELTGVPMVINTSFNRRGEPIVCSPEDAYACFQRMGPDYLAMGGVLVHGQRQAN